MIGGDKWVSTTIGDQRPKGKCSTFHKNDFFGSRSGRVLKDTRGHNEGSTNSGGMVIMVALVICNHEVGVQFSLPPSKQSQDTSTLVFTINKQKCLAKFLTNED